MDKLWGKPAPPPEVKPVWSTYELADYLDQHPQTVIRWCKQWFGELGKGFNVGRQQGYRIPWQYVYVGRLYVQTDCRPDREAVQPKLLSDPKDFVVRVDDAVYTCYSASEAAEQVVKMKRRACVFYVGEYPERLDNGTRSEPGS